MSRPQIEHDGAFPRDLAEEARIRAENARHRLAALADRGQGFAALKARFKRRFGWWPDYDNPRTFNEKIGWRKIRDRQAVYTRMVDKFEVRRYVAERLGATEARRLFPPVLLATDTPETLRFADLPPNLALKCNHGSGWNILIRETMPIDHALAVRELRGFLLRRWRPWLHEWANDAVPRNVVVEEMLRDRDGDSAGDMKLHFFHGTCRLVEYFTGHFDKRRKNFLAPDFSPLAGLNPGTRPLPARPGYMDEALAVGARLSAPFDYLRVDFLITDRGFHLNELTVYSSTGMRRWDPPEADAMMGEFWHGPA